MRPRRLPRRSLVVLAFVVGAFVSAAAPPLAPADVPPAGFPIRLVWSAPPSTHPDTPFTYTATVTNTGATGTPVFLQQSSFATEAFVSAVPGQGSCAVAGDGTWRLCSLGSVAAGASVAVTFTSKLNGGDSAHIMLTALPAESGGVTSVTTAFDVAVIPVGTPLQTDLRVTMTGPDEAGAWSLRTYTITVRNNDSVAAHGVVLEAQSAGSGSLIRGYLEGTVCPPRYPSPAFVECVIPELAPGASATMTVDDVASVGFSDTVFLSLTQDWNGTTARKGMKWSWSVVNPAAPVPESQAGGSAGLLRLEVARPDTVELGVPYTWTDTITNLGAVDSGPLTLATGMWDGALVEIVDEAPAACMQTVVRTYCNLPGLAPGESTSVAFTGYPFDPGGGPSHHKDFVLSNGSQAVVDWVAELVSPLMPTADLAIEPVSQAAGRFYDGQANSASTWRITNNGPVRAWDILVLHDVSPATSRVFPTGCCVLPFLEPGASLTVTLITNGPDATVTNRVRVYHSGPDPTPANNSASADAPAALGGGGGGGGGSGGGGLGQADLKVALSATRTTLVAGGESDLVATVTNGGTQTSINTHLVITLPPGATLLGPPAFDRGSGCTGVQVIDCNLDFLPVGLATRIVFALRVDMPGTVGAVARSDKEANPTDNAAYVAFQLDRAAGPQAPGAVTKPSCVGVRRSGNAKPNRLTGTNCKDVLKGRGGSDVLLGLGGGDVISGGPGRDRVDAGSGADSILVRDGERDVIRCGAGRDSVSADRRDVISTDCEVVRLG